MINKTKSDKNLRDGAHLRVQQRREALHGNNHSQEFAEKIQEDVNFLRDRIKHIQRSHLASSNPFILKTYESMLESRLALLASINHESDSYDARNTAS